MRRRLHPLIFCGYSYPLGEQPPVTMGLGFQGFYAREDVLVCGARSQ